MFRISQMVKSGAIVLIAMFMLAWTQGGSSKSGKYPKAIDPNTSLIAEPLSIADLETIDVIEDEEFYEIAKVGVVSIGKKTEFAEGGVLGWGGNIPFIFMGNRPIDFSNPVPVGGFGSGFGFLEDSSICGTAGCGEITSTFLMKFKLRGIFYGPPQCRLELDIVDAVDGEMGATETTSLLTLTAKEMINEEFEADRVVDRYDLDLGNVKLSNVWWLGKFDDGGASGCQSIDYDGYPDPATFQQLFDELNKQSQGSQP